MGCLRLYVADRWWGQAVYPSWWPNLTKDMQTEHELKRVNESKRETASSLSAWSTASSLSAWSLRCCAHRKENLRQFPLLGCSVEEEMHCASSTGNSEAGLNTTSFLRLTAKVFP